MQAAHVQAAGIVGSKLHGRIGQPGLARPVQRAPRAGGNVRSEQGQGQEQHRCPPPAASPNPFRKTPLNHERRLTSTFRPGSSESGHKGVRSKARTFGKGLKDKGVRQMIKKLALSTAIAASALAAVPAAADAQSRYGSYNSGYHNSYRGYDRSYRGYDNRYDRRYAQRYNSQRYGNYYGNSCRRDNSAG